jgi:hypothetical protein
MSPGQKWTRFGQLRQCNHVGRISIPELDEGVLACLWCNGLCREHLHALGLARGY